VPTIEKKSVAVVRAAPKLKKKRVQERNANIAALEAPNSAADVHAVENKSFASKEAKLYAPEGSMSKATTSTTPAPATQNAQKKSVAAGKRKNKTKNKNKKKAGSTNNSSTLAPQEVSQSTQGSWNEEGGPKGPMPKLPTSFGARPNGDAQDHTGGQGPDKSWANVAQGVKGSGWGVLKK
jgi:hypothetical protein